MTSYTETQKNGVTIIVDMNGFEWRQARDFLLSPKHAQRMVQVLQVTFIAYTSLKIYFVNFSIGSLSCSFQRNSFNQPTCRIQYGVRSCETIIE